MICLLQKSHCFFQLELAYLIVPRLIFKCLQLSFKDSWLMSDRQSGSVKVFKSKLKTHIFVDIYIYMSLYTWLHDKILDDELKIDNLRCIELIGAPNEAAWQLMLPLILTQSFCVELVNFECRFTHVIFSPFTTAGIFFHFPGIFLQSVSIEITRV